MIFPNYRRCKYVLALLMRQIESKNCRLYEDTISDDFFKDIIKD